MPIQLSVLEVEGRAVPVHLAAALGTAATWQLRVFVLVWLVFILPLIVYLLTHPAVLLRRVRGGPLVESEPSQKLIVALLVPCVLALFAVSVLDSEHGWSHVPVVLVLLGDLFVASGLVLIWLVLRANPYAAANITVETEQTVISTGPYALVRHPMYSGALLLFLGVPLGLGSWWGLVFLLPFLGLVIWRLLDEERYLSAYLPGYRAYCTKVTRRLIPGVW